MKIILKDIYGNQIFTYESNSIPRVNETIELIDKGIYKVLNVTHKISKYVENITSTWVELTVDYIEISDT